MSLLDQFREIWLVDFEFHAPPGHRPEPLCLVAWELRTGRRLTLWRDQLGDRPPFDTGRDSLIVAYYASAECGCFLALGWELPANVLDLYAEFRCETCGRYVPSGNGLLGALSYYGLPVMDAVEKTAMRDLAIRGGPYTAEERTALLDYCASDVRALELLLDRMEACLHRRALLRGRYMKAAAIMEWHGIPLDGDAWRRLVAGWDGIKDRLIQEIGGSLGIYRGRAFSQEGFARWLAKEGIPWPRLDSGALALDDDTFKLMAAAYPQVAPIRELRTALSQLRLQELSVGPDNRNRTLLSAYRSRTGRNQPSNSRFAFGPGTWIRGLIMPPPGRALAYIDWAQQEFGIAAALSGDPAMIRAYQSGDPYLEFAKLAGAAPPDATKASHKAIRDQYKATVLGTQYCMGPFTLAERMGISIPEANRLLAAHRRSFPRFWRWSDAAVDYAILNGRIHTVFGWTQHVGPFTNPRSLRNFPMQANGAEILRLACCYATEAGIQVCAPVHDALLVGGPAGRIEEVVRATQAFMRRASADVLGGFELESDAKIVCHPERYMDERGRAMWTTVMRLLDADTPPADGRGTPPAGGSSAQSIKEIEIVSPRGTC
jgi:hypothetical protein